jgi:hypothetical protein
MISVDDERALVLRHRFPPLKPHLTVPWKTSGVLAYIVFFFLTLVGVAALAGFCQLIKVTLLVPGVLVIVLAEYLIGARRWWATGVEAALWIGGLFTLIFSLEGEAKPEAILLFAAASAIAGARVRQPLFGALAAVFVLTYFDDVQMRFAAFLLGIVITITALVALTRTWKRPSTEWLWIALLLVMPVAAYIAGGYGTGGPQLPTIAVYAVLAIVCLAAGIRMRHHAPLLAAMIVTIVLANEAHELFDFPAEVSLAMAGFLLLGGAWLVSRALRGRTEGLVATPEQLTPLDSELELLAAVHATPDTRPAEPTGHQGGGGTFGGAGATGDY